jgi:hypothetical protein
MCRGAFLSLLLNDFRSLLHKSSMDGRKTCVMETSWRSRGDNEEGGDNEEVCRRSR